jgi:hypothetical protein
MASSRRCGSTSAAARSGSKSLGEHPLPPRVVRPDRGLPLGQPADDLRGLDQRIRRAVCQRRVGLAASYRDLAGQRALVGDRCVDDEALAPSSDGSADLGQGVSRFGRGVVVAQSRHRALHPAALLVGYRPEHQVGLGPEPLIGQASHRERPRRGLRRTAACADSFPTAAPSTMSLTQRFRISRASRSPTSLPRTGTFMTCPLSSRSALPHLQRNDGAASPRRTRSKPLGTTTILGLPQ